MVGIASRRHGQDTEPEDDRLVKLFRNRSELKKEFAKLRREGQQLQEQLQRQEGETLRSQQQLEKLEGMLAHPVQAANAAVFYQLRGVWNHCRRKLARLAEELLTHHRDRELKLDLDQFDAARKATLSVIDRHEQQARDQHEMADKQLDSIRRQYLRSHGFWNYFKRRALATQMETADAAREAAVTHLNQCLEQKKAKEAESPPVFDGLTVEGRRRINLVLIAIAQELYLYFSKRNIAGLAREASVRQVTDVNYGDASTCRDINIHIEKRLRSLPPGQELVANVRDRVAYLRRCASYRRETDTVPVAGSFAEIPFVISDGGEPRGQHSVSINVLADEYWDVYTVMLT